MGLRTVVILLIVVLVANANGRGGKGGQNRRDERTIDDILGGAQGQTQGIADSRGRRVGMRETADKKSVVNELDIASHKPVEEEEKPFDPRQCTAQGHRGLKKKCRTGRPSGGARRKRNALINTNRYWPGNVVHYSINEAEFSPSELDNIQQAIGEYTKYTCIAWILRTSETDYVNIIRDTGCYSFVGKIGGMQTMSLAVGCATSKRTPVHEMMHALGVFHQHTRPDRDSFVQINFGNVISSTASNFAKKQQSDVNLYQTAYSYESVMHYSRRAFTVNNLDTITTLDSAFQNTIGTAPTFSFEDIQLLTQMYSCSANCQSATCPPGAFQGHDCNCYCKTTNPQNPVANCGEVCILPDQECTCNTRNNACSGISNSACNPVSGACECNSGYVSHNDVCTLITSITCSSLGVDCKCSLNPGSCGSGIADSMCNNDNTCSCSTGFGPNEDGGCTDISSIPCNVADLPCFCDLKAASCALLVPSSSCDNVTRSCTCDEDFLNVNGGCSAAATCTALSIPCDCTVQGTDACGLISGSVCDAGTDSCKCDPSSLKEEDGVCVSSNILITDGQSLAPFSASASSTTNFVPMQGTDMENFGVSSNDYFLHSSGTGSGDKASIETEFLPPPSGFTKWCVEYSVRMANAVASTEYEYQGYGFGSTGISVTGVMNYWHPRATFAVRHYNVAMQFRIIATPNQDGVWSADIDPVKVYACTM